MTAEKKKSPLVEAGLIAPLTTVESGWNQLDSSIETCVRGVKEMRKSVAFLKKFLDHPFHVEALDNIDGLIDEALIPYLAEIDKEFRQIAPN